DYTAALAALPDTSDERRHKLEVAAGHALVSSGSIVEGQEQLEKTLRALESEGRGETEVAVAARHELAASSYYAAWLMRLQGARPDEWKPEAERARQQFRLLAEGGLGNEQAARIAAGSLDEAHDSDSGSVFRQNLEATIRLERMDLGELLARPLPKNCPKCKQ